jgi:Ferritin-like domain
VATVHDPTPELDGLTLERLDADGALAESIAELYGSTRADFVRTAVFGGSALLGALAIVPDAIAAQNDTRILNFDLLFEYLQASFYTEAERIGTIARMKPEARTWARTLGAHERAHVRILKTVLGKHAVAMEDLTVALLSGQAPRFQSRQLTAAVFSLLTVEARHAAWARRIRGFVPVAAAFDRPKPISEVRRIVASTRFVASRPRTTARKRPPFTG